MLEYSANVPGTRFSHKNLLTNFRASHHDPRMVLRSWLVCGLLVSAPPLFADRIVLKNGKAIENVTVVRMTGTQVVYRAARRSKLRRINYSNLANVKYGPRKPSTAYLKQKRRMKRLRRKRVPATQADPLTTIEKRLDNLEKRQRDKEAALKWAIATIKENGELLARQQARKQAMKSKGITPPARIDVEIRDVEARINKLFAIRQAHEKALKKLREEERQLGRQLFALFKRIEKRIGPLKKESAKKTATAPAAEVSAWPALLRSAIVPGWGQLYGRETWKGAGLLGAHVFTLAFILNERRVYRTARNDRDNTRLQGAAGFTSSIQPLALSAFLARDSAQFRMDRARGRHNTALLFLAGVYTYNLLDIAFLNGGARAGFNPVSGTGFFTFQWRF